MQITDLVQDSDQLWVGTVRFQRCYVRAPGAVRGWKARGAAAHDVVVLADGAFGSAPQVKGGGSG